MKKVVQLAEAECLFPDEASARKTGEQTGEQNVLFGTNVLLQLGFKASFN